MLEEDRWKLSVKNADSIFLLIYEYIESGYRNYNINNYIATIVIGYLFTVDKPLKVIWNRISEKKFGMANSENPNTKYLLLR